jgi:methionyl-tRNA formyltransferase
VKQVALEANIPVYQPASLRPEEAADPLRDWEPEAIVVAAFGQILRPHVLDLPPGGCINVHASLLPRWRGASPIQHALLAGDETTGVTLMKMDVGLDTGPMYVQDAIPISGSDTSATLHDQLAALGADLLTAHLDEILDGRLQAQAQNDELATYAPMIKKEAGCIDWTQDVAAIDRQIRAMTPWPGAFTTWDGRNLKILEATPIAEINLGISPGTVSERDDRLVVQTGDGLLALEHLQLAGKKAMDAATFIRGRPQFANAELGS